jgi:nitrous oxidase accessory protein NosD
MEVSAATRSVPGTYSTIQDGIDAADPGDTVDVAAGTYTENLVIDKQLILQGAGSGSTTIDASGGTPGILLSAGGVSASQRLTISGFTISGSTLDGIRAYKAGGLDLDYVTFDDLVLTSNSAKGVEIHNDTTVTDLRITDSVFLDNTAQGLRTASNVVVNGMTITDSSFDGNSYNIYLQGTIDGLTITGSEFVNSTNSNGHGAYMTETGPLTNVLIEDSNFINNGGAGMMIWNVQDNADITIRNTVFQDNAKWGMLIWGDTLTDVLVEDCTVKDNDGLGTGYWGIDFYTYSDLMTNVDVHGSSITGHSVGGGVKNRNTVSTAIVDATVNYWGDASGPYDPVDTDGLNQLNLGGLGDDVTEYVLYDPWLGDLSVAVYSCVGFEPPMHHAELPPALGGGAIARRVKKNRVFPFKATLVDADGNIMTDLNSPPILVVYEDSTPSVSVDITDDSFNNGKRTDGIEFFLAGSKWNHNLASRGFGESDGTYTGSIQSGDNTEYIINPTCEGLFVIEP